MKKITTSARVSWALLLVLPLFLNQCKPKSDDTAVETASKKINISLAQWSIHHALDSGILKAEDFASIAKNDFGISAIEYVSKYYKVQALNEDFWKGMKGTADSLGVKSLLIMIDDEGDLGNPDSVARKIAVENHFKWIDAAGILGCHSVRVNAFGDGSKEEVQAAMVSSLKQLCAYAQKKNINVLIENHGLFSSDAQWVVEIMKKVGMPNCGTLPDFGNWCTSKKWGGIEAGDCEVMYDPYQGVSEMLPFARGVSAKSYAFDEEGEEKFIDYSKMLLMVKGTDFSGHIGIEYEGKGTEADGIKATKALLEKSWEKVNQ